MRSDGTTDQIESIIGILDPCIQSGINRIIQGSIPGIHGHHFRSKHFHAHHVRLLTSDILRPHIDRAFHAKQGGYGSCRNPMLTGTGLGNQPILTHPLCKESESDRIIYLVSPCVVEIFSFQIYLRTVYPAQGFGVVQWRRTSHIIAEQTLELSLKLRIGYIFPESTFKFLKIRLERFGNKGTAKFAIKTIFVNRKEIFVRVMYHNVG